jgi:hypothetical protein
VMEALIMDDYGLLILIDKFGGERSRRESVPRMCAKFE